MYILYKKCIFRAKFGTKLDMEWGKYSPGLMFNIASICPQTCSTYLQAIVRQNGPLSCMLQSEILNFLLPPDLQFSVSTVFNKPKVREELLVSLAVFQVSDEYGWAEHSEIE